MITLLEINKAIDSKVENAFKDCFDYDIPLVAEDLSEPIVRPSVKIIGGNLTSGKFNNNCRERTVLYRLYFFAKNRYKPKFENLKAKEALEAEFMGGIFIDPSFYIPINEMTFEESDGVLSLQIELYTIELMPDLDKNEPADEINIRI